MANVQQNRVHARVVQRMPQRPHLKVVNQQVHQGEDGESQGGVDSGKGERPEVLVDWHPAGGGKGCREGA